MINLVILLDFDNLLFSGQLGEGKGNEAHGSSAVIARGISRLSG